MERGADEARARRRLPLAAGALYAPALAAILALGLQGWVDPAYLAVAHPLSHACRAVALVALLASLCASVKTAVAADGVAMRRWYLKNHEKQSAQRKNKGKKQRRRRKKR